MTVHNRTIRTERFNNNFDENEWDQDSPGAEAGQVLSWCANVWDDFVDQMDEHDADWDTTSTEVPESAMSSNSDTQQRMYDANDWAETNLNVYSTTDAFVMLDYFDSNDGYLGYAYIGGAGDSGRKIAIVNMEPFEGDLNDSWYFSNVEHHGTGFHELGHLYSAEHKHGEIDTDDETSLMTPATGVYNFCRDEGDRDERVRWVHGCSHTQIRNHHDQIS